MRTLCGVVYRLLRDGRRSLRWHRSKLPASVGTPGTVPSTRPPPSQGARCAERTFGVNTPPEVRGAHLTPGSTSRDRRPGPAVTAARPSLRSLPGGRSRFLRLRHLARSVQVGTWGRPPGAVATGLRPGCLPCMPSPVSFRCQASQRLTNAGADIGRPPRLPRRKFKGTTAAQAGAGPRRAGDLGLPAVSGNLYADPHGAACVPVRPMQLSSTLGGEC